MSPDQMALLADTRLPGATRIIGLIVGEAGEEGVELARDDIRGFLGPNEADSDDTIARHLRRLETTGWVERKAGGRGHADRFRLLGPHECGSNAGIREGMRAALSDRLGTGAALSADRTGAGAALSAPTSSSVPPPPPPLETRARAFVLESDSLKGCRGSLLDYLGERVAPDRQLAYAQTVVGMVEGTDERLWKGRNLRDRITDGRPRIIAGCLNELRQGDEVGKYFPGPPGDVRNLQSKIRYKVKAETDARRDAERRSESKEAPGAARAQSGARPPATRDVRVER